MQRILLSFCFILVFTGSVFAGPLTDFIFLQTDAEQNAIQVFTPNPAKDQLITAGRTTINMSAWLYWNINCSVEWTFHNLTSAVVTGVRKVIPASTDIGRGVYHGTVKTGAVAAFTSFSTSGTCTLEGM